MIMKLKFKHLAPYLPYNLMVVANDYHLCIKDFIGELCSWEFYKTEFRIWSEDELQSESVEIKSIKPLLRPVNSITEEEAYDLISIAVFNQIIDIDDINNLVLDIENSDVIIRCVYKGSIYNETKFSLYINYDEILFTSSKKEEEGALMTNMSMYQYLFSKHFDVFGLINKGLAVDKTELK